MFKLGYPDQHHCKNINQTYVKKEQAHAHLFRSLIFLAEAFFKEIGMDGKYIFMP
ncbi:hypothetical protein [Mucilaginibacter arboris]|uniref:Uncharacterized protein n=1 Tax=Mucilaginibacter arboris TaxID=2682090 RepID=A0A7K1SZ99_9SPHI|nr:hypothetical protein [Mucilaginibacter arboris]MVN22370.1 hypothetical protein [Mucilaginibacter arboris]